MDDALSAAELRQKLQIYGLDFNGTRKQMLKRLEKHYRNSSTKQSLYSKEKVAKHRATLHYDYLIVIDFECTCEQGVPEYPHEIIEFPAVLINVATKSIVDHFRTYVRPVLNPKLSAFCTQLTGISQTTVNAAPVFAVALKMFRGWMQKHNLDQAELKYAYVTDGLYDIAKFLQMQFTHSNLEVLDHDFRSFINIRTAFWNRYRYIEEYKKSQKHSLFPKPVNLAAMLEELGMTFQGHQHSGLDDSRNIAAIVVRMLEDGSELRANEKLVRRENLSKWVSKEELSKGNQRELTNDTVSLLPYRTVRINRKVFLSKKHTRCESCDEEEEEESAGLARLVQSFVNNFAAFGSSFKNCYGDKSFQYLVIVFAAFILLRLVHTFVTYQ
uniref:SAP domain-containing protein n=1 Tax=Ditylenchus dipsaci TaxID=166011 RepID=A0A915DV13_9BILA